MAFPSRSYAPTRPVPELSAKARIGDGCYGFSFSLSDKLASESAVIDARVANLGDAIGAPVILDEPFETLSNRVTLVRAPCAG